ncbi:MAG: 2-oxoglutarate and iron-dependent oxygenase domain-containing protein [Ilumatobacter sp.]|uniref:isopenicillin N synthase family dioxygenase n=1 Tax=Ilumatobacter sp. TaxID=1967498 RepID=UPI003298B234
MSTVPIIDISGLASDDLEVRRKVAREIGAACETIGFLCVTGHGVDDAVVAGAFEQMERLFALPFDDKMAKAMDEVHVNRGYDPPGRQRLDADSAADMKEAWSFSPEHLVGNGPMSGDNQWPDMDGFREPIETYHIAAMDLCERLMRAMALSLDLDEDHFAPFHRAPTCTLRLLRYPPRPDDAGATDFGAGAHTDWGAVTVLAQDGNGSLEVVDKSGDWVPVPPIPDSFVINIGDLMQRWTNDRYVSTMHRVLGVPGRERYSVACFFDLDHDALIEVLDTCVTAERPALHGPVTAGEHLNQMYLASIS